MTVANISAIERRVIKHAEKIDALPEICNLVDYHPEFGRVPEHWRVKPEIMYVINHVISDERSS